MLKRALKRVIPPEARQAVRSSVAKAQLAAAKVASHSNLGASLYYTFLSGDFYREHRSVLLGKIRYWRSLDDDLGSYAMLRRNTHRLEKGLIMQPRRETFAADYIGETVDCFKRASASAAICHEELAWARDVLTTYFAIVKPTPAIREAEAKFKAGLDATDTPVRVPYEHRELPAIPVSFDALEVLFTRRRSVRWFTDQQVDMADIENAIRIAALAPSACNRQPFEFHVLTGPKAAKVAALPGGAAGFLHNIPCLIAVVGNLAMYPLEKDRHLIYIDGSLASMQLMLALETLGLSTCSINWPDLRSREPAAQKLLGIEPTNHVVMLIAVGYAATNGGVPYSQKKRPSHLMKLHRSHD